MRRRVLPHLLNLAHLEAAGWQVSKPDDWNVGEHQLAHRRSLAFANALVLKTSAYRRISSLGIRGLPYRYDASHVGWEPSGVRQILVRIMHFGWHLKQLDLDFEQLNESLTSLTQLSQLTQTERLRWPNGVKFWGDMLQALQNLQKLKFTDSSYRFEHRDEKALPLDEVLKSIKLAKLRVLHLSGWSITAHILTEGLLRSFPALKVLDLELLDLHSDDFDGWQKTVSLLEQRYGETEINISNDVRRRPLTGPDGECVKKLVKK